jgi:hypothetical protein
MAHYFFVLEGKWFEEEVRPALGACRRQRSFAPALRLCATLRPAAEAFTRRYHTAELFLMTLGPGIPFDRDLWRLLVGEVLLVGAVAIPEFQTCEDTLCCLLAPEVYRAGDWTSRPRAQLPTIVQAHRGSRDLTFADAVYHPQRCGYNNSDDVARLTAYLEALRPEDWTATQLDALQGTVEADRAEELEFSREWFPSLRELYQEARAHGRVVVTEEVY